MCNFADHLWLESLDITGCYKVTDDGLDVLTMACTGMQHLYLRRLSKLSPRGLLAIGRNIRNFELQTLDIRDCNRIISSDIDHLISLQPLVTLL